MRVKRGGYINSKALSVTVKTGSKEKIVKFNALSRCLWWRDPIRGIFLSIE